MTAPLIGERYRGVEGHIGFLLVQAWHALRAAMDTALRPHDLTPFQYGALSVLARDPGLSGADLARACNLTPQAVNEVLPTLVNPEKQLNTIDDVKLGVQHLIAEMINETAEVRALVRRVLWKASAPWR